MTAARRVMLAIETSNPSAAGAGVGVALGEVDAGRVVVRDHEGLQARGAGQSRGGLDDDLMPAIARLMERNTLGARDLERVCVSAGPGGYTGLRVACAAGKMIAEAGGCGCAAVRSAHAALAATLGEERRPPAGLVAVLLASKQGSSWCEVFDVAGGAAGARGACAPGLVECADMARLASAGVRTLIGDQFVHTEIVSAARASGMHVLAARFDAPGVLKVGALMETMDPAHLNPLYPREPDAVTLWRARHGGAGWVR